MRVRLAGTSRLVLHSHPELYSTEAPVRCAMMEVEGRRRCGRRTAAFKWRASPTDLHASDLRAASSLSWEPNFLLAS